MKRAFFLTGLLVLAGSAAAQTPAPGAAPAPAPPPAQNRPTPEQVTALVTSDFPTRDADHDGSLNQDEFKTWLTDLVTHRQPGQTATAPPPDLEARIAVTFTRSDADQSGGISPAEMITLLTPRG